jgi:hypothetical protein
MCPGTSACWDIGDVRVISTADSLCDSPAFRRNFQLFVVHRCALCSKFLVLLESPNSHSPRVALIPLSRWSSLNTQKSLGVQTANNSEDWGQGIVEASWLAIRALSTVNRKSGSGAVWQWGENELVPHHAWTTCCDVHAVGNMASVYNGCHTNRSTVNSASVCLQPLPWQRINTTWQFFYVVWPQPATQQWGGCVFYEGCSEATMGKPCFLCGLFTGYIVQTSAGS